MKSLQNNYNLIKEGKGNKELFLKQAKREFPQHVTNVLTFNQAVSNLKERGINYREDGMFEIFEGKTNVDLFDFKTPCGKLIDIKVASKPFHSRIMIPVAL